MKDKSSTIRSRCSHLADGIDLTGDPAYVASDTYAGLLLVAVAMTMPDLLYRVSSNAIVNNSTWSQMIIFVVFFVLCILSFCFSSVVGLGNVRALQGSGWILFSFLSATIFHALLFGLRRTNRDFLISVESAEDVWLLGLELIFFCIYAGQVFILIQRWLGYRRGVHIVLLPDAREQRWGADDVLGLIRAARVKHDMLAPSAAQYLSYPSLLGTFKEIFYPQPFDDRDRFSETSHFRELAKDVQIVYPIRLRMAFIIALSTAWVFSGCATFKAFSLWGDREAATSFLVSLMPSLDPSVSSSDVANSQSELDRAMSLVAETNNSFVADITTVVDDLAWQNVTANSSAHLRARIALTTRFLRISATFEQYAAQARSHANLEKVRSEGVEALESAVDILEWAVAAFAISVPLALLLTSWFLYVSLMAYRKGLLELAFSVPHYRFHPEWHNCLSDKKFFGVYLSCFSVGFALLIMGFFFCGLLVSWSSLWSSIFGEYWMLLIATLTYYIVSLGLLPFIHQRLVCGKSTTLVHPRRQAALIFVLEIFYVAQTFVSVISHIGVVAFAATIMLFRPDRFMLGRGWEWLDMMHFVYASMQHEQLRSGVRLSAGTELVLATEAVVPEVPAIFEDSTHAATQTPAFKPSVLPSESTKVEIAKIDDLNLATHSTGRTNIVRL